MRKPDKAPQLKDLKSKDLKNLIPKILGSEHYPMPPTYKEEYIHWDDLQRKRPLPEGLSSEEWWFLIKMARHALGFTSFPCTDTQGNSFAYIVPPIFLPQLSRIDRQCGQFTPTPMDPTRYVINSLMEEAITSSQLEGAATTRRVAKEMLLTKRKPVTESERMIFNNYQAMLLIKANKERPLDLSFILDIHRILTENLQEDAGQLRKGDDIRVEDTEGNVMHYPPPAKELEKRLKRLCEFVNQDESQEKHYLHPVIKAILLHFILAYLHPFTDGNGRTARALFYWFMLHRDYKLIEYIAISEVLKKAPHQYGKAFLHTETDENDATYFIAHQLKVILRAIEVLYAYIEQQKKEHQQIEQSLDHVSLNHRQLALIKHALKHPDARYEIKVHRELHHLSYQTARSDLLELMQLNLLVQRQHKKAFVFTVPPDLKKRLDKLSKNVATHR